VPVVQEWSYYLYSLSSWDVCPYGWRVRLALSEEAEVAMLKRNVVLGGHLGMFHTAGRLGLASAFAARR